MLENYPDIGAFLRSVTADVSAIFHANVFGLYLTGSLTTGSFRSEISDIDLILILKEPINSVERTGVAEWARVLEGRSPLVEKLDLAIIDVASVRATDGKTQRNGLEFWRGRLCESNNTLADNLLVWSNILACGVTLLGVGPRKVVGTIPHEYIRNVMHKELLGLKEQMAESFEADMKFRYFVVTTLCRMQYTEATQGFVSKEGALEWYQNTVGAHPALLDAATAFGAGEHEPIAHIEQTDCELFIRETEAVILAH